MIWTVGAPAATRIAGACAVLVLTLFFNIRYLATAHLSAEEEHFLLGQHLHATGVLSIDGTPAFFRPPGFPAFVAFVLRVRDAASLPLDDKRAVALGHACLLSLGGVALFLHTVRRHPVAVAFAAGVLFAFHPLNLLIARNLTYYTLHIVLVAVATLALSCAVSSQGRRRTASALGAGLLWGAATLVRPMSLLLPPFLLLLARWVGGKGSWSRALGFTCLVTAGMAVVVAPYTLRNYRLTHRLIVVNAQDGFALWGLAVTNKPAGDTGEWFTLWREEGERIFTRATGVSPYTIESLYPHVLALNDAFRAEARQAIGRDPARFARNAASNLVAFNVDYTHVWLRLGYVSEGWDWPPRVFLAQLLGWSVLVFALAGVVRGLHEGDADARMVAAVYCMFWAAHGMVILMSRYTYVRFPLVLVAFPLALRGVENKPVARRLLLAAVVLATFSAWDLAQIGGTA